MVLCDGLITVDESANHSHKDIAVTGDKSEEDSNYRKDYNYDINEDKAFWVWTGFNTGSTGGDKPHNNIQPCKAVYIWTRTA